MELPARFKNIIRDQKTSLEVFMEDNPDLVAGLDPPAMAAYTKICTSVSHWRSKKARAFFLVRFHDLVSLEDHPFKDLILKGAVSLSVAHWALIQHYFSAVTALPLDASLISQWTELTHKLYDCDIDVAVYFTQKTSGAVEAFGPDSLLQWGEQAAEAIQTGRRMYKATCSYLENSVAFHLEGSVELSQWGFFLQEAARISKFSADGAEAFIREGVRMCLILGEKDIRRWVDKGLEGCSLQPYVENRNFRRKATQDQMVCDSEEELINYFSGISSKGLNKRDDLVGGVMLKNRVNTLALMCEAILGKRMKIASNQNLFSIKGFTGSAATDGRTIYLPDTAPSFKFYKLLALHQAMVLNHEIWKNNRNNQKIDLHGLHLEADQGWSIPCRDCLLRWPSLQRPTCPKITPGWMRMSSLRPCPGGGIFCLI